MYEGDARLYSRVRTIHLVSKIMYRICPEEVAKESVCGWLLPTINLYEKIRLKMSVWYGE